MPWTETLPSGLYRAVWRDAAGRKRSRSPFVQQAEAKRYAGEQESLARRGLGSYVGRTLTWGGWCDTWTDMRRVERTTSSSDTYRIERWLRPRWGSTPLGRIDAEDVQVWVNELGRDMSPASVAKVYRLLSSSLRAAVKYNRLPVSPCVGIELPHVPPPDERFLTRGEVDTVLHYMREPYRTAAILLVGTGMRYGEMAGLHTSRIDFAAGTIEVHETWDGQQVKAYPKGRKKRTVPLVSWVAAPLLALIEDRKTCGLPHARGNRCRSGLAITAPEGGPMNAHNMLQRHWAPALARAGLDHARQHDLRHTTASWLIQDGRSLTEVAAILGHSEMTVTARYAHLSGTHMDAVRLSLENGGAPYSPHSENPPIDLTA